MSRKNTKAKSKEVGGKREKATDETASLLSKADKTETTTKRRRKKSSAKVVSTTPPKREGLGKARGLKLLFLIGFTLVLIFADSYFSFEKKVSDVLTYFNGVPLNEKQVVIIGITDEDYRTLLNYRVR